MDFDNLQIRLLFAPAFPVCASSFARMYMRSGLRVCVLVFCARFTQQKASARSYATSQFSGPASVAREGHTPLCRAARRLAKPAIDIAGGNMPRNTPDVEISRPIRSTGGASTRLHRRGIQTHSIALSSRADAFVAEFCRDIAKHRNFEAARIRPVGPNNPP